MSGRSLRRNHPIAMLLVTDSLILPIRCLARLAELFEKMCTILPATWKPHVPTVHSQASVPGQDLVEMDRYMIPTHLGKAEHEGGRALR